MNPLTLGIKSYGMGLCSPPIIDWVTFSHSVCPARTSGHLRVVALSLASRNHALVDSVLHNRSGKSRSNLTFPKQPPPNFIISLVP